MPLGTPSTLLHKLLWVGTQYGPEALKSLSPYPKMQEPKVAMGPPTFGT